MEESLDKTCFEEFLNFRKFFDKKNPKSAPRTIVISGISKLIPRKKSGRIPEEISEWIFRAASGEITRKVAKESFDKF